MTLPPPPCAVGGHGGRAMIAAIVVAISPPNGSIACPPRVVRVQQHLIGRVVDAAAPPPHLPDDAGL
jgi:hypothetical protein